MTDKVQKIREEVERLKSQLLRGACSSQIAMETMCKEEAYNEVLAILDTMQEEPVSIWHDAQTEQPQAKEKILATNEYGDCEVDFAINMALYWPKVIKWAYINDLLNLSNVQRTTNDWKEPVSEDFEKIVEEIAEPTILNAYGTKELARRLRNTMCGTSVSEELEEAAKNHAVERFRTTRDKELAEKCKWSFKAGAKWQKEQFEKERLKHCDGLTDEQAQIESDFVAQHLKDNNRTPTFIDAIEYGMKMQKEQMMAKAIDGIARPDDDEVWCDLKSFNFKDGDKVKVIVIKED